MFSAEVGSSPAADGSKATKEQDVGTTSEGFSATQPTSLFAIQELIFPVPSLDPAGIDICKLQGLEMSQWQALTIYPSSRALRLMLAFGAPAWYGTWLGSFFVALVGEEEISWEFQDERWETRHTFWWEIQEEDGKKALFSENRNMETRDRVFIR